MKNRQRWVSLEMSLQIHCCIPVPESYPLHRRRNFDFIFIGSEVTAQTRLRMPATLRPIALHHLT